MLLVKKPAAITGCAGSGFAGGGGVGAGAARHSQVWFQSPVWFRGAMTLHSTPSTPLHVNTPRQPTAHIRPSWGRHPNVVPSTQGLSESCFVQEQLGGGDPAAAPRRREAAARTRTIAGAGAQAHGRGRANFSVNLSANFAPKFHHKK